MPPYQHLVAQAPNPLWGPEGRELFYRSLAGDMMVVPIDTGSTFNYGNPTVLFEAEGLLVTGPGPRAFDISSDGRRFLMVRESETMDETAGPGLVLVQNWFQELTERVPVN